MQAHPRLPRLAANDTGGPAVGGPLMMLMLMRAPGLTFWRNSSMATAATSAASGVSCASGLMVRPLMVSTRPRPWYTASATCTTTTTTTTATDERNKAGPARCPQWSSQVTSVPSVPTDPVAAVGPLRLG